jgi:hypothetical protein
VSYIITLNKTSMLIQLDNCGCKYVTKIINFFATGKAEDTVIASMPVVVQSFDAFLKVVRGSPPEPDAVDDPLSPIGRSYYAFWKTVGDAATLAHI